MQALITSLVLLAGCWESASAASYRFGVEYFGSGNATLAAGSDDPTTTTLVSGDDFGWTITAQGGASWQVIAGGDFFPLMGMPVAETGERIGDITFVLRYAGVDVFTVSESFSVQSYVHVGTNSIGLGTGLVFDQMKLSYSLIDSRESPDFAADPNNLLQIGSSPTGLLPIFGAPEMTGMGAIVYAPIPEPQTAALLLAGLGCIGWVGRRRARRA